MGHSPEDNVVVLYLIFVYIRSEKLNCLYIVNNTSTVTRCVMCVIKLRILLRYSSNDNNRDKIPVLDSVSLH